MIPSRRIRILVVGLAVALVAAVVAAVFAPLAPAAPARPSPSLRAWATPRPATSLPITDPTLPTPSVHG